MPWSIAYQHGNARPDPIRNPGLSLSRHSHGLVPQLCPVLRALDHSGHAFVSEGPRPSIRAGEARDYGSLFSNSLVSTANADVSSSNNLNI